MPPGGEDNQGGGQDIPGQLAPRGQAVQGGKINCYTGLWFHIYLSNLNVTARHWIILRKANRGGGGGGEGGGGGGGHERLSVP